MIRRSREGALLPFPDAVAALARRQLPAANLLAGAHIVADLYETTPDHVIAEVRRVVWQGMHRGGVIFHRIEAKGRMK